MQQLNRTIKEDFSFLVPSYKAKLAINTSFNLNVGILTYYYADGEQD